MSTDQEPSLNKISHDAAASTGRSVVLLVEDHPLIAMVTSIALKESGREVLGPVQSASEALDLAEKQRPTVAVIDVHIAGEVSGIDLARALRDRFDVLSLIVSGTKADTAAARQVGVRFLEKPFTVEQLERNLKAVEAAAQRSRVSGLPDEEPEPDLGRPGT